MPKLRLLAAWRGGQMEIPADRQLYRAARRRDFRYETSAESADDQTYFSILSRFSFTSSSVNSKFCREPERYWS